MKIILYTKTGCPWCAEVLKLLNDNNIEFEEKDARKNENYFKELVEKSGQNKTPTLEVDGQIVASDSDVESIGVILKEKGIIK